MPDRFCIMPFRHQMIEPGGSVKICCMVDGYVEIDGRPASVQEHLLDVIWRADSIKQLRTEMLAGGAPATCHRCYDYEAAGGTSYRMMSNALYREPGDPPLVAGEFAALDLDADLVDGKPDFYQLVLGNFCNLKCRMCSATFSSSIENDPVHAAWAPHTDPVLPNWRQNRISIGPQPTLMVKQTGLGETIWYAGSPLCWTTGEALLTLPWREGTPAERIEIDIWPDIGRDTLVSVTVNGRPKAYTLPESGPITLSFSLADIPTGRELSILIESRAPDAAGGKRALPLKDVRLFRPHSRMGNARVAFTGRFAGDRPWYEQNSLLFAELLAEPKRIRKLQITGGEPFLLPQMEAMLDYLIDTGVAANIVLNMSSNCTALSSSYLEKLGQFRRVELCLSIEGVEEIQEYVRYPSQWKDVIANVDRFRTLANAVVQVNPTIQIYNFLHIDRLIRWCDSHGLAFYPQRLVDPPYLSISVAPRSALTLAAERIRAASGDLSMAANRQNAAALAHMLMAETPAAEQSVVENFMFFTNDLDRSRGQSFADAHAELLAHFEAAGTAWLYHTVFFSTERP